MKILILGDRVYKKEWNSYYQLKHHIKVKDWKNFIEYIKKYKEIEGN